MNLIKCAIVMVFLTGSTLASFGQTKYFTRDGKISFVSKAAVEDIEAVNRKVTCV